MFGQTVADLIKYISPVDADSLADFDYDESALSALLSEKADIVFSFLPSKYRRLYESRVFRLIVVPFAKAGQTEATAKFTEIANVVGYKNPPNDLDIFSDAETVAVEIDTSTLTFPELAKGDVLVIDFDNDMTDFAVPSLAWATKVLASIDLLAILSGELKTGDMVPRIKYDADRVFAWLEALSSTSPGNRVIVRQLECQFWDGQLSPARDLGLMSRASMEGI